MKKYRFYILVAGISLSIMSYFDKLAGALSLAIIFYVIFNFMKIFNSIIKKIETKRSENHDNGLNENRQ